MPKKPINKYIFSLIGVNIEKIDQKYGIGISSNFTENNNIPKNSTKITDLDTIKKTPDIVSFLDESKRIHKCSISMIDYSSNEEISTKKYKCFWDKNFMPDGVQPIGCPIKYVASRAIKTYYSEISKDKYTISEQITDKRYNDLENRDDKRITLDKKDYYETDGIFCSFNCCMAYIDAPENKHNPLYRYSETLLLKMYNKLVSSDTKYNVPEILPAPHWRLLEEFGGHLTIEQFRETFNKVEYKDHGLITCKSIGKIYEDNIKF
jgi:hypothetical protein